MDESNNQTPWELVIANCLAEVLTSDVSNKTKELRISALNTIRAQIYAYQGFGIIQRLLTAIAEKKCKFLMEITSKTEMAKMLKPHCPTYNGNEFNPISGYRSGKTDLNTCIYLLKPASLSGASSDA